jgi:hypothetical protein
MGIIKEVLDKIRSGEIDTDVFEELNGKNPEEIDESDIQDIETDRIQEEL